MQTETTTDWQQPTSELTLDEHVVHVWRAGLVLPENQQTLLWRLLTPEEQQRAQRFHFEHHRQRWIAARGVLRHLLSIYTHSDPLSITLKFNDYGKPALAAPRTAQPLHFNISHSHDYALYAFAYQRELGVDIEQMRPNVEFDALAKHSFSPLERATFHALLPEQQMLGFYQCWTRKEAYIKARGMGLSLPLELFDVTLRPGEPARLLASREDPQEVQRWQLYALPPVPGYAGALFVERQTDTSCQLSCWQWTTDTLNLLKY